MKIVSCYDSNRDVKSCIYNQDGLALTCGQIVDAINLLAEIKEYAKFHHSDEESCVWLHSLTIDIPSRIEREAKKTFTNVSFTLTAS